MASVINNSDRSMHKDDEDDEDIEALRLAALMTLRKKPTKQPTSNSSVTFKPHFGNPNLIAIIPEGAEPVTHKRQNFFRHHPPHQGRGAHHQQYRSGPAGGSHTALKVLPQLPPPATHDKRDDDTTQQKEEVSTKFSRFEDTESESEDESENEEKESNVSSDESEDVLALEDEDDSLEALMAQMEHEIEAGIDLEPNKKEKKKSKNIKSKEKEQKNKLGEKNSTAPEKPKAETKTAIVEPTMKDDPKKEGATAKINERPKSPVKIQPIVSDNTSGNLETESTKKPSPLHPPSDSSVQVISQCPSNHRSITPPPKAPQGGASPSVRIVKKSRSRSRSRSIGIRAISPLRRKSPRRLTPDGRSPMKRSPGRYYSGKRSTSPYYQPREREYSNRSRSPVRRKSLSPRRTTREPSPKYYHRRSRSPWSPGFRHSPNSPRYRSPIHRRSLSPRARNLKPGYSSHSPFYRGSPKQRTPSVSPRRSLSPVRKSEYSPQRRRLSPKRDYNYRRNSLSPRRKQSPPPKKYSPQRSPPRRMQRTPSPRRNISPRRRGSPLPIKECRSKAEKRSRSPSLSLSPSPLRESKGPTRRFKSPLRPRREVVDVSNRPSRPRRPHSPAGGDGKEKRKPTSKQWERERENRPWERKNEERRRERGDKTDRDARKDKETNRSEKEKAEEVKDEGDLKISENPLFEARRKKFESTALVEPASKKIRLVSKKTSEVIEKLQSQEKTEASVEEKKIVEHGVQTEDDLFSGQDEVDEIDNFLNEDQEDVLDLSAEVWDSDEDLLPKVKKTSTKKTVTNKVKTSKKHLSVNEKAVSKEKLTGESRKIALPNLPNTPPQKTVQGKSRSPSPELTPGAKIKQEERDESDLRAELSRRREERLTKAGSLHEKLPRRLLQDAFESALGKKKVKREGKPLKSGKESKKKEKTSPVHKEKTDGRRVLVLKRPAPVKMQSAHINVTFPSRNAESDSESSYTSSSSSQEEERYAASAPKRKLPVYMRLGTATTQHKRSDGRKVKLHSRRSQRARRVTEPTTIDDEVDDVPLDEDNISAPSIEHPFKAQPTTEDPQPGPSVKRIKTTI